MDDVDLGALESTSDLVDVFADLSSVGPSEYIRRVIELDNVYNRKLVAKTFVETLKRAPDDNEFRSVLELLVLFSRDPDLRVRVELVEQIPNIAIVCFNEGRIEDPVGLYLLPLLITTITDTIPQVRKTAETALLVLLENSYLKSDDIERKIWPTIGDLSLPDNMDDLRCEAVALMTKMAPLVGGEMTQRLILNRFLELCGDSLFHVRKACAANFSKLCEVLPQEVVESRLLGKFFLLCEDELWGVRKACAESATDISRLISAERRSTELTTAFHNLLTDYSRWVRIAAFHNLGPFIATFADPKITGLSMTNGFISRLSNFCEELDPLLECPAASAFRRQLQQLQQQQQQQHLSGITSLPGHGRTESVTGASGIMNPLSSSIGVSEDESLDGGKIVHIHVDNADNFNSFNYWRSPVPELDMDVDIVEGKPRAIHVSARVMDSVSHRVFTSEIEVGLEESDISVGDSLTATASGTVKPIGNPVTTEVDNEVSDGGNGNSGEETKMENDSLDPVSSSSSIPPPDLLSSAMKKMSLGSESSSQAPCVTSVGTWRVHTSSSSSITDVSGISGIANSAHLPSVSSVLSSDSSGMSSDGTYHFGRVRLSSSSSSVLSASQRSCDHSNVNASSVAAPGALAKECKQTVLPRSLFLSFLNMADAELAQTVDTEITRHCAFSFMAVAFTLGPKHWLCLKNLYETLAQDMQWKTRRSLAFSLHELATVVGDEATCRDLVTIFYDLAHDVDEVKQGLVYQLTSFASRLNTSLLHELLERLEFLLTMENERYWRYRVDMANELSSLISILSIEETKQYIYPRLWSLLFDKVAEVRMATFQLVGGIIKKLESCDSDSTNDVAVMGFLRDITQMIGESKSWVHRQTFVRLVIYLLSQRYISEELCSASVLLTFINIGHEKISNLRIAVARGLTCILIPNSYFLCQENPWQKELISLAEELRQDPDRDVRELMIGPDMESQLISC